MKTILTDGTQKRTVFDSTKGINAWDLDADPEAWTGQTKPGAVFLVPAIQSALNARCKAMADLPFVIYDKAGAVIDHSNAYKNTIGFMPTPRQFFWIAEASLVTTGAAYFLKNKNKFGVVKDLQYFLSSSLRPVLDTTGLTGFARSNSKGTVDYAPGDILHVWLPDPGVEIGPPGVWPLAAALVSAGALSSINNFVNDYMSRGAIKAMLLSVKNMPDPEEAKRVENWFNRMMKGAREFTWKLFNADEFTPTIIGDGLEAFNGITITADLTAQIHTAMGTRQMLFDESYATADIRQREFYANTIVPDGRIICDALNSQVLKDAGYRIEIKPELLEVFQDDASVHAVAMGALAKSFEGSSPAVIELAMSITGVHLNDDQRAMLEEIGVQRAEDKRTAAIQAQNEAARQKNEAILTKMRQDVGQMKALTQPESGKPSELEIHFYGQNQAYPPRYQQAVTFNGKPAVKKIVDGKETWVSASEAPTKTTILPTKINYYDPKAEKPDKGKAKQ